MRWIAEQSGSSLELYNSVLFLTSEDEARDAFNQLSGDTHASVKTGLIDTANLTADAINNRLRSAFAGVAAKDAPVLSFAQSPKGSAPQPFEAVAPASYDYGVWASGFGSWVDHDGNSNAGGLKTTTGGFVRRRCRICFRMASRRCRWLQPDRSRCQGTLCFGDERQLAPGYLWWQPVGSDWLACWSRANLAQHRLFTLGFLYWFQRQPRC